MQSLEIHLFWLVYPFTKYVIWFLRGFENDLTRQQEMLTIKILTCFFYKNEKKIATFYHDT